MSTKTILDEIQNLKSLLQLEKNEDLKQYRLSVQNTSFEERRKKGVCWYPIQYSKSKYNSTEQFMIRVTRNESHAGSHQFQSGKLVSIFSNISTKGSEDLSINGVVNQVRNNEMWITLHGSFEPDWLSDGKIGVQLLFDEVSYREMENGLKQLLSSEDKRLNQLRDIILGKQTPQFKSQNPIVLPELNETQNDAMNKALAAEDVAIIHGPPGTGKTTTLVQTILQTLKSETQVLVCAPSNAAADLLAVKLGDQNIDVVRIGNPARVSEEIISKTLDARCLTHSRYKELRSTRAQANEYRNLANKYKRNFGKDEREQRAMYRMEAKRLRYEANALSDFIKEDILIKTRVIVTTLVGSVNPKLKDKHFSTVFIDEAAQGLEPATWLPILKSNRVIFAGDHFQLPPTLKSFEAAKNGLEVTLFEKAIQRLEVDVMLSEQYRMHETIMRFSGKYFYKDELKANEKIAKQIIFKDDLPIEFIDTSGCGFEELSLSENKSTSNPEEANLLFTHFKQYIATLEEHHCLEDVQNIGIISPYKAQVTLLYEQLNEEMDDTIQSITTAQTIDSFQGQERDIVYISLVRSNEKQIIGFLKDIRRMNVAMTRARKKMVIIGDSTTICSHPFYNAFFDYVNEVGGYKSAFELMY